MVTWKELLEDELLENKDSFDNIIKNTMTDEEMSVEFCDSYGGYNGIPFTVWTHDYVYFPIGYDGSEWVGSAPRNPCDIKLRHQGGG